MKTKITPLAMTLAALFACAGHNAQAQTTINDTDNSIIYSSIGGAAGAWKTASGTSATGDYNSDEHYTNYDQTPQSTTIMGPIAVENFNGTAITLYGKKGPNFGIGAYSIDGGSWFTVDAYNSTLLQQQALVTITGLTSGPHVLAYQLTNNKNASSSNIYQVIDKYVISGSALPFTSASVGSRTNGAATFSGTGWAHGSYATDLSGSHSWSGHAGDSVSWSFTGNLIEIFGRPDTGDGYFDVYIDGTRVAEDVDGHYGTTDNDALTAYMLWASVLPSNGSHTIEIVVKGTEDSNNGQEASGIKNLVQFDEFAAWSVGTSGSGGTLSGTVATASSSYNLTTLGTVDWAHWNGTYIHSSAGGSKISDVTQTGGGTYGTFSQTARNITWTNGTPTTSGTNDHNYIWCNGASNSGWTFTVPADTSSHTVHVLCGGPGTGANVQITAHLSDSSAPDYTDTKTGSSLFTNEYTFTYTAASAGKTLVITVVHTNSGSPSCDLDAAWLTN